MANNKKKQPEVTFCSLGETGEIGGSCHYLNIEGTGIVLDVGHHPEDDSPAGLPRLEWLADKPVDHAIITHAHHDHLGALPVFLQRFPYTGVHMTPPTRLLAEFLLPASARLQHRRLLEGSTVHQPLFTQEHAEAVAHLFEAHELKESFDVTGVRGNVPVAARFFHAGHVLGAASVELSVPTEEKPFRIYYTSDVHIPGQTIQPGADYPLPEMDVLIIEATLAADEEAERTTREQEEQRFLQAIQETLERGGSVLIPVFALGRAQEILALLNRFKQERKLAADIPVYTAGAMRAIAEVYDRTREFTPRQDPAFEVIKVAQKRLPRKDSRIKRLIEEEQGIYVVSSGMMFERTLSNRIARWMVDDDRNSILLVGYAKEDSPAARLLEARKKGMGTPVVLAEEEGWQQVYCEVERFRFSGHSHRRELLEMIRQIRPHKVVLVHAEDEAREWMRQKIALYFPDIEVYLPEQGQPIAL